MPAAAWFTLIVAALIIAITAVGLLRVIFHLRAIRKTLVATTGGVQAVAILMLARSIGNEAPKINDALTEAVQNTAPLGALRTTIEHATIIIGGLQRGRARLGG